MRAEVDSFVLFIESLLSDGSRVGTNITVLDSRCVLFLLQMQLFLAWLLHLHIKLNYLATRKTVSQFPLYRSLNKY